MGDFKDRLREHLSLFGKVEITDFVLHEDGSFDYPYITLTASAELLEDMQEFVNLHLNKNAGYKASLGLISTEEIEEGRFKYRAEIVPNIDARENIDMRKNVIYDFMKSLPREIRSFRMQERKDRR